MKIFINDRKKALLSGVIAIVVLAVVGVTLALLIDKTGNVDNAFTPSEVTCAVDEDFNGKTKEDVRIQNTGDVDAYIRAKVILNWVDPKDPSIISSTSVEKAAYTAVQAEDYKWIEGRDGYFYYPDVIPAGENKYTGYLFESIKVAEGYNPPAGYVLSVEIIADAVQAIGVDEDGVPAVTKAWGIAVKSDGTLDVPVPGNIE